MKAHLTPVAPELGEVTMPIGEQIKDLRKERGWSQADLAAKINGDAGQISRYEHGRITPSADVIIRLAEVFDVTTDYLLLEDAPRRPRRTPDEAALGDDRIAAVAELNDQDLNLVASFIDAPRHQDQAQGPRQRQLNVCLRGRDLRLENR